MKKKTIKQFGIHNLKKGMRIEFPKNSYTICENFEIDVSNKKATIWDVDYRGGKRQSTYVVFDDKKISKHYIGYNDVGYTTFSDQVHGDGGTDVYYLLKAKVLYWLDREGEDS